MSNYKSHKSLQVCSRSFSFSLTCDGHWVTASLAVACYVHRTVHRSKTSALIRGACISNCVTLPSLNGQRKLSVRTEKRGVRIELGPRRDELLHWLRTEGEECEDLSTLRAVVVETGAEGVTECRGHIPPSTKTRFHQ